MSMANESQWDGDAYLRGNNDTYGKMSLQANDARDRLCKTGGVAVGEVPVSLIKDYDASQDDSE